jgi:hypothetical protein
MLGAFVLPIGKFAAARNHLAEFDPEHPLRISALGPKTASTKESSRLSNSRCRCQGGLWRTR